MASNIFYPVASGDDSFRGSISGYYNNWNDLYMGDAGEDIHSCIRFPNVNVPQGATITEAYVKFTAYASNSNTVCNLNCYFNNVDNAVAPGNAAGFDALILTGPITWSSLSVWTNGVQYTTPSLVSILQNIVDRAGFSSGNAVQVVIKNNSSSGNAYRQASSIDFSSGTEKAELHVTWEDPLPEVAFTFSNPIPAHLSTVYGATKQLQLTTTVSGEEESYTYDAAFYDDSDVQIGSIVSGINSGSPVGSNDCFSTPSGTDYSWYVTATSSGGEDTSQTYTFSNRFLYEGYVTENDTPVNRMVRLYYRNTGELVDSTTSSGGNGYYRLGATTNDEHFIVAFDDEAGEDYNSLILDRLLPNEE